MKNLTSKLIKIMVEAGSIPKAGHNDFHNYNYVMEADVVSKFRDLFAKYNIFVYQSVVSQKVTQIKDYSLTEVEVQYQLVDVDSGEIFSVKSFGQGADKGDKGVYKAITGAHKYFLMKNFNLPTGDDPEKEDKVQPTQYKQESYNNPQQQYHDYPAPQVQQGEYTIPFGKYKGKKFSDIQEADLVSYIQFIQSSPSTTGKPVSKGGQELIDRAQSYLNSNKDIPF